MILFLMAGYKFLSDVIRKCLVDSTERKVKIWQWITNMLVIAFIAVALLAFSQDHSKSHKEKSRLIGCSYMTMNNEFYQILNEQVSHRVEAERDRLMLRDPALDVNRQIEQINSMIDEGVDALVVTPVDSSSLSKVLRRARKHGIKIIVVDSEIDEPELADCTIVSDNYNAGSIIGKYYLKDHEEGQVVILTHESTASGRERVRGFKDTISANSEIRIMAELDCQGQVEIAMPVLRDYLEQGKKFDSVFCLNDLAAMGAASALEEAGILNETDVYGVDGSPDVKALIAEGKVRATAQQFPTRLGFQAGEALYKLLQGEKTEKNIIVPVELLNSNNVEDNYVDRWQ